MPGKPAHGVGGAGTTLSATHGGRPARACRPGAASSCTATYSSEGCREPVGDLGEGFQADQDPGQLASCRGRARPGTTPKPSPPTPASPPRDHQDQDPDHFRTRPRQGAAPTTVSPGQHGFRCCTTSRRRICWYSKADSSGSPVFVVRPPTATRRSGSCARIWGSRRTNQRPARRVTRGGTQPDSLHCRFAPPRPQTRLAQRSVTSTEPARDGSRGVLTWAFRSAPNQHGSQHRLPKRALTLQFRQGLTAPFRRGCGAVVQVTWCRDTPVVARL